MATNTPDLYELTNQPKSATHAQMTKAYKKAALAAHPDHGGSTEAMAAVSTHCSVGLLV